MKKDNMSLEPRPAHQFKMDVWLGGGNSKIFYVHPEPWENGSNLTYIFPMGWNHQLDQFKMDGNGDFTTISYM